MSDGTELILDDEILYRRVPAQADYYNPAVDSRPTPLAFRPRENDTKGLSVSRAKYRTMEQVARNPRGKRYYVAVLQAGKLRAGGIAVEPDPLPNDPGHALLPSLTYQNRKTPRAKEQQVLIAEALCLRVEGPFP
jgi:hypothetical protein